MPQFEVWASPGGKVWEGSDQEEAFLTGIGLRRHGALIEVVEIADMSGHIRPRCIAAFYDRFPSETSR